MNGESRRAGCHAWHPDIRESKSGYANSATDQKPAARYQEAFKKAGARLRVLPVEAGDQAAEEASAAAPPASSEATPASSEATPASSEATPASQPGLNVLPVGSDLLTNSERSDVVDAEVDTSHLAVQDVPRVTRTQTPAVDVPNVDHFTLAELGAQIGSGEAQEIVVAEIDVDFDLAEVGAILGALDSQPAVPPVDVDAIDFELAEPGADMGTAAKQQAPPPPDTSHLKLDDN